MRWFAFGFNAFGQICVQEISSSDKRRDPVKEVKVSSPTELKGHTHESGSCVKTSQITASWSRRASVHLDGDSCVCLAGFESPITDESRSECLVESRGCRDAYISRSLALGGKHAVLLTAAGGVYTWGEGSHGQLGHGGLISEEEPRIVEALWGMPMSSVAAGGWHSVCISDGGDLYVWGWNESGQLGLPCRNLRKCSHLKSYQTAGQLCQDVGTSGQELHQGEKNEEVFISIQAFPALLDVTPSCELRAVSCGSRHTAAVTTTGDLYTWGWGEYGQLGHQTLDSLDEPQRVEFFRVEQLHVVDVVCGPWNTFTAVVQGGSSQA